MPDNEKYLKMTSMPVEKLILGLAVPSIVIMLVSAIYNITDTFFVSRLGTSQVAAVGIAFPLMAVIQAMGFFFGQGSGNYIARALGAQDNKNASAMAVTGLISGFLCMTIIAGVGLMVINPLIAGLGATETIKPYAKEYIFFILLASPWMAASTILNQQLRFQGSASIAMTGMLSGAILNIFIDPIFIFILKMGVKGASLATMISQIVSFTILFFYGTTRRGNIPINFRHFSPSVSRYVEMSRGGVPALLRQGLASVSNIVINHFARHYGDAAIAAISISNRLCMFVTFTILGFGQAFQPVCGFNYGAKLYDRVKKAFWFCFRLSTIFLLVLSATLAIFAPNLISLFRKEDMEVIRIGTTGLRLNCTALPFAAGIILSNMTTQTMGMAMEASIIALARQGLFLIPYILLLGNIFGLLGIQLSVPAAELTSLAIIIPILIKTFKKLNSV